MGKLNAAALLVLVLALAACGPKRKLLSGEPPPPMPDEETLAKVVAFASGSAALYLEGHEVDARRAAGKSASATQSEFTPVPKSFPDKAALIRAVRERGVTYGDVFVLAGMECVGTGTKGCDPYPTGHCFASSRWKDKDGNRRGPSDLRVSAKEEIKECRASSSTRTKCDWVVKRVCRLLVFAANSGCQGNVVETRDVDTRTCN